MDKLKEVWCDKHPEFGYNGCVAILDPSALARAILERGRIAGKLINEDFGVEVGSVAYEHYDKDFLKAGLNSASLSESARSIKNRVKYGLSCFL